MKRIKKILLAALGSLMMTSVFAQAEAPVGTAAAAQAADMFKLIATVRRTELAAQKIGRDYLYIGNKIATRAATASMKDSLVVFRKKFALLEKSINNPDQKNLLVFVNMAYTNLKDAIAKPYSLDNAQEVLDYTQILSEALKHVSDLYTKQLAKHAFLLQKVGLNIELLNQSGLNAALVSIAKYYMAYQAGIRDQNSVSIMRETVEKANKMIEGHAQYPLNTPQMNQQMVEIKKLWGIVSKFYEKIEDGGLPFIVYKTVETLNNVLVEYNKGLIATLTSVGKK